jgi:hypothetical protein
MGSFGTLPPYGPCTCTVLFKVLMLDVMPGRGVCVELTEAPLCAPRPDSGSGTAAVPPEGVPAGPSWAHKFAQVITRRTIE